MYSDHTINELYNQLTVTNPLHVLGAAPFSQHREEWKDYLACAYGESRLPGWEVRLIKTEIPSHVSSDNP